MNTWKYHVELITLEDLRQGQVLNNYGALGWELLILERIVDQDRITKWLAVFKKPEE
jgi:hypothetical protein